MTTRPAHEILFPTRGTIDGTETITLTLVGGAQATITTATFMSAILGSSILASIPTPPVTARTYQRDTFTGGAFGKGAGAVTLVVNVSASASTAEYRLRDYANPGTVLADWTALGTSLTAGNNTFTPSIPAGPKRYLMDVRANGFSGNLASTTQPFGVGEVVMAFGQSLCSVMWYMVGGGTGTNASAGITPSATGTSYAKNGSAPADGWSLAGDSTPFVSVFVSQFVNMMEAGSGVVCSLSGRAIGATAIAAFISESGMSSVMSTVGKWRTTIWNHGHSDGGSTQATYYSSLTTLIGQIDAANTFSGTKLKVMMPPPDVNTSWGPNIYQIRAAHAQYVAANPATSVLCISPDIKLIDGTHPDNVVSGGARNATHAARAVKGLLGLDTNGDKGPTILTVTRASGTKVFSFTVQHAGGTALSSLGTAYLNFQFYPVGTIATTLTPPIAGSLTPTAFAIVDATHFTVTVSDTLTDSQAFDVYYGWPYVPTDGSTVGVWDNNTVDGGAIGRALTVNTAPITCAAPSAAVAPGTPTVAVGSATSSSLTLSLSDSTGGTPSYYTVQRSTASDFSASLTTLNSGSITYTGATTTYVDSSLSASTTYYYRATATNGTGTSSQSTGVSGTTSAAASPTITVTSVSPLVAGSSSTVSGAYTNGTPTGFNYAIDGGSSTAAIGPTISGGTYSFTITAPATGSHSIVVTGTGGNTASSSAFSFTTSAAGYPAPTGTSNVVIFDIIGKPSSVTTDGSGNVTAVANQVTNGTSNNIKNGNGNVTVAANAFGTGRGALAFTGSNNLIHNTSDTWMAALGTGSSTWLLEFQCNYAGANGYIATASAANSSSAYIGIAGRSVPDIAWLRNPAGSVQYVLKGVTGAATTATTRRVVVRYNKASSTMDMWVDGTQVTPAGGTSVTNGNITGTVDTFVLGTFTTAGANGGDTINLGYLQIMTGAAADADVTGTLVPFLAGL